MRHAKIHNFILLYLQYSDISLQLNQSECFIHNTTVYITYSFYYRSDRHSIALYGGCAELVVEKHDIYLFCLERQNYNRESKRQKEILLSGGCKGRS